jgi:hypothetical protein
MAMSTVSSRISQANLSPSPHKPVKEVQYRHVTVSAVDKSREVAHYNSLIQFRLNTILSYIIVLIEFFTTVTYFSPYLYIDPKWIQESYILSSDSSPASPTKSRRRKSLFSIID